MTCQAVGRWRWIRLRNAERFARSRIDITKAVHLMQGFIFTRRTYRKFGLPAGKCTLKFVLAFARKLAHDNLRPDHRRGILQRKCGTNTSVPSDGLRVRFFYS